MQEPSFRSTLLPLWLTYSLVPLLVGLDKFFNLLVDWEVYLAPFARRLLPFSGETFMMIVGVIEIAAGVLAFTRYRRLAAYIVSVWLLLIAVNLVLGGFYDIAVRDLAMSVGAFTLGQLAGLCGEPILPGHAVRADRSLRTSESRVQPAHELTTR